MNPKKFDVCIAGAGPAGSVCALFLAKKGLNVLLLDKATFPRDKACADNKSWKCTSIIKELGLWKEFQKLPRHAITKMFFSSPTGHELTVPLEKKKIQKDGPHYNVRRVFFDNFLFQAAKRHKNIKTIEGFEVTSAVFKGKQVTGVKGKARNGKTKTFFAKVVVGADGSTSAFSGSVGINPVQKERHAVSARAYFSGVKFLRKNTAELHYLKNVCPGYFWIFPVDKGLCNVGVGLPLAIVEREKIDVKNLLHEIISSKKFSKRFQSAKMVSEVGLWGITISMSRKKICGNGFVLCGDAANTAVTFAGEGVGPAMRSGKIAAHAIAGAFEKNDFSEKSLSKYEDDLWKIMGPENNAMKNMEFLATHPQIYDFMLKAAKGNPRLIALAQSIGNDYRNASRIFSIETLFAMLSRK